MLKMYAGLSLQVIDDDNRVAVVLTWKDLAAIEGLLGSLPYDVISQFMLRLMAANDTQTQSGMIDLVQDVITRHGERLQMLSSASTSGAPN